MQLLGSSSFMYRMWNAAELQPWFPAGSTYPHPIPFFADRRSPWPGAAGSCAGQLSSALPVLANGVSTSLTFCGQSFLPRETSTACAAAGLQQLQTQARPVALVAIWRTLDCLYLLTFSTKSFPPNTKVLITDRNIVTPRSRDESVQSGISITTDYDCAPAIKSYKVAFIMWMLASN